MVNTKVKMLLDDLKQILSYDWLRLLILIFNWSILTNTEFLLVRRLRKSDNLRVARACGATIVNRTDEITEDDIGTDCGLFEVRKIGDEYFTFLEQCKDPKACTILLRGASKDILNEVERNLQDALNVAR